MRIYKVCVVGDPTVEPHYWLKLKDARWDASERNADVWELKMSRPSPALVCAALNRSGYVEAAKKFCRHPKKLPQE